MHRKPLGTPCSVTLDMAGYDADPADADWLVSESGSWYHVDCARPVRSLRNPGRWRFSCVRIAAPDPEPKRNGSGRVIEFYWLPRGR